MSDEWISIILKDPDYVPPIEIQRAAETYFKEVTPEASQIKSQGFNEIQFFDAGGNFSSLACPYCKKDLEIEWWQEKMDDGFVGSGFVLKEFALPCCGEKGSLNTLEYYFEQGFGKYILSAMNPNIGVLEQDTIDTFESIFRQEVKVIYRHL